MVLVRAQQVIMFGATRRKETNMSVALRPQAFSFASLLSALTLPKDPFGLAAGLRAHEEFQALGDLRDDELAARGLSRDDVNARILKAMRAA